MSAIHCWYCGSDWCSGDRCGGKVREEMQEQLAELKAERDRLLERVEGYAYLFVRHP